MVELKWLDANCVMSMMLNKRRKVGPLCTGETAFRQDIGKLVLGFDIFDLDLWVQIDSVK